MAIKSKNLTTTTSGGVKLQLNDTDGIISIYNPSTREVYREMDVSGKHDAVKNIILMLETML
mgnify:CR=1 FL=1